MLCWYISSQIKIFFNKQCIKVKKGNRYIIKKKPENLKFYYGKHYLYCYNFNIQKKVNFFFLRLLSKIIKQIDFGFLYKIKLVGIGYKIIVRKNCLIFKLGYSHNICYSSPNQIWFFLTRDKSTCLNIFSYNAELVYQIVTEIYHLKPVEPYKGKGFHYFFKAIYRKEGKQAYV